MRPGRATGTTAGVKARGEPHRSESGKESFPSSTCSHILELGFQFLHPSSPKVEATGVTALPSTTKTFLSRREIAFIRPI